MKKFVAILIFGLIFSTRMFASEKEFTWHDMEVKYYDLYQKVLENYDYEHLEYLFNICNYVENLDEKVELTWSAVKSLLDNPTELP